MLPRGLAARVVGDIRAPEPRLTEAAPGLAGVYSYRVSRRLFVVPLDPGVTCRLCGTPRDQRVLKTLVKSTQVR